MQSILAERDEPNVKHSSSKWTLPSTNSDLTFTEIILLVFIILVLLVIVHACDGSVPKAATVELPAMKPVSIQRTGELETRASLERIFGKPFVKVRPSWIVNPKTNRRLELDCYNEELGCIAAEYNGIQHSVFPNPFHSTLAEFEAQQWRDAHKAQACQQHGVCLLVVPHTVARPKIENYLRRELQARGFLS